MGMNAQQLESYLYNKWVELLENYNLGQISVFFKFLSLIMFERGEGLEQT